MKPYTRHLVLCFLSFGIFQLQAQVGGFTQFYNAPLSLNPALTGMDCGPRFSSVIRYQDSPYSFIGADYFAMTASLDFPLGLKNGDRIGLGARWELDQYTPITSTTWVGGISLSYQKKIFKKSEQTHFLIAGMDGGLAGRRLDTMASHLNNPFISHVRDHYYFGDFSGGLAYHLVRQNGDKITVGVSATHLGRPTQLSFYDQHQTFPLDVRYCIHGDADLRLTPRFGLSPWMGVYLQRGTIWAHVGTDLTYSFDKAGNKSIGMGGGLRECFLESSDFSINYLVLGAELNWNRFTIKFSHDLGIRHNGPLSSKWPNASEIAIIYRHCRYKVDQKD